MHKQSNHVPNPDDGYEINDVSLNIVLIGGLGMVALTVLSFGVSLIFGKVLNAPGHEDISDYTQSEFAGEHNDWNNDVRLQSNPPAELAEFKAEQHVRATTFGTLSESPEIYHIPIDKALDHVAEHGLPVWAIEE